MAVAKNRSWPFIAGAAGSMMAVGLIAGFSSRGGAHWPVTAYGTYLISHGAQLANLSEAESIEIGRDTCEVIRRGEVSNMENDNVWSKAEVVVNNAAISLAFEGHRVRDQDGGTYAIASIKYFCPEYLPWTP